MCQKVNQKWVPAKDQTAVLTMFDDVLYIQKKIEDCQKSSLILSMDPFFYEMFDIFILISVLLLVIMVLDNTVSRNSPLL